MPKVGLEPTPSCLDRILSPARLPFRHFGLLVYQQFTSTPGAVNAGESRVRQADGRWIRGWSRSFHQPFHSTAMSLSARGVMGWNET